MRAGLDEMQPKWTFQFVDNPLEALEAVPAGPDAVVIDLLTRGVDGADLFRQIMQKAPGALRLGLSSPEARHALERAGAPVHQFLPRPCDPKVLKAVLARAFASQDFLSHVPFRQLV